MVEAKTKIERYESYKDSGIEWLGEIPEHWKIESFKHILTERNEKNSPIKTKEILSLSIDKGVTLYAEKTTNLDRFKDDFSKYKLAHKGDLVFNSMNMIVGAVGVSDYFGCVSPVYYTYYGELNNSDTSKFYEYLFRSKIVQGVLYSLGKGLIAIDRGDGKYNTLRLKVSRDDLRSMKLPFPNTSEQTQIVQFLNDKTTKIEDAIAIKEQQIILLKERKKILIHKAVTRGLDDSVTLKDSGVEWIGEIPKHWEVKKLFGICDFVRGNTPFSKDELLSKGDYVALQYGKTYKVDEINDKYNFYVNDEFYKESQIVNFGDTILVSTSETIEDLGHSAYYNRNDLGLLGGEQMVLKPKKTKLNGHYLYFFSKIFSKELRKYATGIKVFRFNVNDLKTIYGALPPFSEQKEISEYIEAASQKIETAIGLKQQEIEKLKEYKSSLINGVVTGKVKMC